MTDWIVATAYLICGAILVMMVIGIAFSAFMPALDRWNRRYFITFFSILLMYAVVLFIDMMIYTNPDMAAAQKAVTICEYLFFSVLMPMPMPFLLHCCGESQKGSVPLRTVMALLGVFWIILFATQFTDIFYYTADDQYFRAPLFPLMIAPLTVITILNIACLIKRRKKLSKKDFYCTSCLSSAYNDFRYLIYVCCCRYIGFILDGTLWNDNVLSYTHG